MSITDELREYARTWPSPNKGTLLTIADRIDAEHNKAIMKIGSTVANGYIALPKDADGEYIHIGDVMYDSNESPSEKFNVAIMELNKWGWSLIDSYGERNEPSQCFHHYEPTIEDVLREFGDKYCDMVAGSDKERDLFAEYAAKLQLRGDGE